MHSYYAQNPHKIWRGKTKLFLNNHNLYIFPDCLIFIYRSNSMHACFLEKNGIILLIIYSLLDKNSMSTDVLQHNF